MVEQRASAGRSRERPKAQVVKIGGSTFDAAFYGSKTSVLTDLADCIVGLHEEGYPMIVTCGGGPTADLTKYAKSQYGIATDTIRSGAANAVRQNCAVFADLLKQEVARRQKEAEEFDAKIEYCENTNELMTNGTLTKQISVVPFASDVHSKDVLDYLVSQDQSDPHTLICAEALGEYMIKHGYASGVRVTFVKNADGVYKFDPNRTDKDQEDNEFFSRITVEDFLENVDTVSYDNTPDGDYLLTGNHLLEQKAAEILRDSLELVKGVRIIYHTPAKNLETAVKRGQGGSLIFNRYHKSHPKHTSSKPKLKRYSTN